MVPTIMEHAKRRILFLITTADWGGAQHFVLRMAEDAKKAGMEVLISAGGEGELEQRALRAGIPYQKLRAAKRDILPLADLATIQELRHVIRDYKPDVIHLNSSKMSVLGSIAARLEHAPRIVYRIGGWAFLEDIAPFKKWIYRVSEHWTAWLKDVIVTVHPGDEQIARELGIIPQKELLTIPNGINLGTFDQNLLSREQARTQLGLSMDETIVGTVANLYGPKNVPGFLDSIARLTHLSPSIRFVVMGDGPEHPIVMKRCAELNLQQRVIFTGRRADASSLLRAFDLFVLPSTKEGMPWALLEAMAAGLPCIATDVGACRWMLEPDGGIVVPSRNPNALAKAIEKLLNDQQQRNNFGLAARAIIETRYRWELSSQQTLELFR